MGGANVLIALLIVLLLIAGVGLTLGILGRGPTPSKPGRTPHHWLPPGSPGGPGSPPGPECRSSGDCPAGQTCYAGNCIAKAPAGACAHLSGPPGPPGQRQQLGPKDAPILSYFQALYPQANRAQGLLSLTAAQLLPAERSVKPSLGSATVGLLPLGLLVARAPRLPEGGAGPGASWCLLSEPT